MTGSYRSRPPGDAPRGRSGRPSNGRYADAADDEGSPSERGYREDRYGDSGYRAGAYDDSDPGDRSGRSRSWSSSGDDPRGRGRDSRVGSRTEAPPERGWRGGGSRNGGRGGEPPRGRPEGGAPFSFNIGSVAVLAGVLVVGIGIGTGISSTTQGDQGNIASSQQLDMAVPDPEFCRQWGASAFVMDVELYTTMNPSSSFVTQPQLKPGCVIRRENWSVLQKEGAVTAEQMRTCKQRMNTFAYVGSVKDKPIVRCVYQTDITENKFVTKGVADDATGLSPEAQQF